ncbi:MAG: hypothetical protein ACOY37_03425 [Pseudomonadota bacterium]
MRIPRLVLPAVLLALAACGPAPDPAAEAAAKAAERSRAADELARQFDQHFAAGNWPLARAHGDVLIAQYPDTPAARRIAAQHAEARRKADAAQEDKRLAALWTYQSQPVGKGEQLSASIHASEAIDTGGGRSRPQLIFRDHPEWGRSSYLVLENGDFDCYGGCRVEVSVDGTSRRMAASRPKTDEAIAMFIEDERALWRAVRDAERLVVTVPVKGGAKHEATFEVGGLDPARMPGW